MSSALRLQDYFSKAVTLAAGVAQGIIIERPETIPALSNTIDHVINPPARRESELAIVTVTLVTALTDVLIQKIEIIEDAISPFFDGPEPAGSAAEPLFPTGAPTTTTRELFANTTGIALVGPSADAALVAFLKNLTVGAGQRVRLTAISAVGGVTNWNAAYDAGLNSSDVLSRGLNA